MRTLALLGLLILAGCTETTSIRLVVENAAEKERVVFVRTRPFWDDGTVPGDYYGDWYLKPGKTRMVDVVVPVGGGFFVGAAEIGRRDSCFETYSRVMDLPAAPGERWRRARVVIDR